RPSRPKKGIHEAGRSNMGWLLRICRERGNSNQYYWDLGASIVSAAHHCNQPASAPIADGGQWRQTNSAGPDARGNSAPSNRHTGTERSTMIFPKVEDAHNIFDLRDMAKRRLPRWLFEFVDRGTDDEVALRNNRTAFERIKLRPRALVDVSA